MKSPARPKVLVIAPRKLGTSPSKVKLIVVAGPTASGKSPLAIVLARRFGGEIISADSRQVYRGMDIGTGKVTKAEQKLARHWLLNVASPTRQYSVAQFKRAAQRAIADITHRGKLPIICGGTGFWIDALVYDQQLPNVKPSAKLRARLAKLTTAQMYAKLRKLDPKRAATIDRHNPRRLVRALEIVMTTGKVVPPAIKNSPYEVLYLGISVPQEKLNKKIAKRLDERLKHGLIAEVSHLRKSGLSWKRLESFGLEYRWIAKFLQKKISRPDMRASLLADIIAYSKRQMTWLRANKDATWLASPAGASRQVADWLSP